VSLGKSRTATLIHGDFLGAAFGACFFFRILLRPQNVHPTVEQKGEAGEMVQPLHL
jgi:hypothetical protein